MPVYMPYDIYVFKYMQSYPRVISAPGTYTYTKTYTYTYAYTNTCIYAYIMYLNKCRAIRESYQLLARMGKACLGCFDTVCMPKP